MSYSALSAMLAVAADAKILGKNWKFSVSLQKLFMSIQKLRPACLFFEWNYSGSYMPLNVELEPAKP